MKINRRNLLQSMGACAASITTPINFSLAKAGDGFFELTAGYSKHDFYEKGQIKSDLWTYNGSTPGPEIRVKQGERVRVKLINRLEEPTTIHWHGIRIANDMDGVSGLTQEPVQPGEEFIYDFVVPDAGSFWYHAHHKSWQQVAMGLYGPLIVEEPDPVFDLEHDLTLVLDDWRLGNDGALQVASLGSLRDWSHGGRLGNWMTVNGKSKSHFNLNKGEAYRLRLINACNARTLQIDTNGYAVIALDGVALPKPENGNDSALILATAQRADLLVIANDEFSLREVTGEQEMVISSFKIVDAKPAVKTTASELPPSLLPEPDLSKGRKIVVRMSGGAMGDMGNIVYKGKKLVGEDFRNTRQLWAMNGIANLPEKPLFTARLGETIIIETFNDTVFAHAMHIHGHHFKIIEGYEKGLWRDTFLVERSQKTAIAFVADNPGKWLYHCHMLEHAAAGMSTWFEVT